MGVDMRETAVLQRMKHGYTTGARTLATRSIGGLARTRITPNALTTAGVSLCLGAAVIAYFEYRDELVFYWLAAAVLSLPKVEASSDRLAPKRGAPEFVPFSAGFAT